MITKDQIQKIRIDIISDDKSALFMLLDRDGKISRQGNGSLPADEFEVISENDGSIFEALVGALDDRVFEHAGVYDHPDKAGTPITYSVVFLGEDPNVAVFEFRVGTETENVGELLPYFDQFISKTVMATNQWYEAEKAFTEKEMSEE